jgi:tRNA pseudouridine38-40 synthase
MAQWKLILAYDGTRFHGWQVQPGLATVQGTLAGAIRHVTREEVLPQGSGRTDTGVHALGQVASFALDANIPPANLLRALNRALPASIRVMSAEQVPQGFHARHSALRKTYEYRVFPRVRRPSTPQSSRIGDESESDRICPPTLAPFVWDCPWHVDVALANRAAGQVLGLHDFTSFAASDPDQATRATDEARSAMRTIYSSAWTEEAGLIVYRVTGSGFLHHMVRNLVGTFVDAASGRLSPDAIPLILAAVNRSAAGQTAPARGLFLVSVEYPNEAGAPGVASETWDQTTA